MGPPQADSFPARFNSKWISRRRECVRALGVSMHWEVLASMADLIRTAQGPADWLDPFEDLALIASVAPAEGERGCIESLLKLLASAPECARSIGYHEPDARRLFALLDAGGGESAILLIIPFSAGLMVSRSGNDHHVASIILPISAKESTSAGSTFALSAVSAFALAISESGSRQMPEGTANPRPTSPPDQDLNFRRT